MEQLLTSKVTQHNGQLQSKYTLETHKNIIITIGRIVSSTRSQFAIITVYLFITEQDVLPILQQKLSTGSMAVCQLASKQQASSQEKTKDQKKLLTILQKKLILMISVLFILNFYVNPSEFVLISATAQHIFLSSQHIHPQEDYLRINCHGLSKSMKYSKNMLLFCSVFLQRKNLLCGWYVKQGELHSSTSWENRKYVYLLADAYAADDHISLSTHNRILQNKHFCSSFFRSKLNSCYKSPKQSRLQFLKGKLFSN